VTRRSVEAPNAVRAFLFRFEHRHGGGGRHSALPRALIRAGHRVGIIEVVDGTRLRLRQRVEDGISIATLEFPRWIRPALRRLPVLHRPFEAAARRLLSTQIGRGPFVHWSLGGRRLAVGRADILIMDMIDPHFGDDLSKWTVAIRDMRPQPDLLFATARLLKTNIERSLHRSVVLVPNGCEASYLRQSPNFPIGPTCLAVGTVDWRVDIPLLAEVARALPHVHFAVIGRVNTQQATDVARLLAPLPNVSLEGERPFDDDWGHVGLIPFFAGEEADCMNTIKMWNYLAKGMRVLSVPTAELLGSAEGCYSATGSAEWVACLTRLLAMPVPCEESRATAAGNTWDVRVATAIEAIDRLEREKGGTGQRDRARSLVRKRRPVQTGSWATVESLRGGSPQ
jgi:hypothetical protein